MGFFLGIDGGGTKTECVLADEAGALLARAFGAGTNLRRTTSAELRATFAECIGALLRTTGLRSLGLEAACAGFAGASDAQGREAAREVLTALLRPRFLYVVGDMEVALEAAVGAGPGAVLIAGTGSIAYGRNSAGHTARAGGHGPERSDEGSGYDIGQRAVVAARGQGVLAALVQAAQLSSPPTAGELAGLVPAVVRAARGGDPAARAILDQAAAALAGLAVGVLRELNLHAAEVPVAAGGGVFAESEEVLAEVRAKILQAAPRAQVAPLGVSPAEGAVRLAQRRWLEELTAR